MGKNKPADLGIGTFMSQVKANNVKTKSLEQEVAKEGLVDMAKEAFEELPGSTFKEENLVGRRKKKSVTIRNVPKPVKFDEEFCQQLALIKAIHKIDLQDFIYVAAEKFRDEYFPKGKATKEGLAIINEALRRLNGD